MSTPNPILSVAQGALASGLVATGGAYFILGERGSVSFAGLEVPVAVALGGTVMLAEALSMAVLPSIFTNVPVVQRFESFATGSAAAALTGGATVLAAKFLVGAEVASMMNLFVLGAASSYVGDSINRSIMPAEQPLP